MENFFKIRAEKQAHIVNAAFAVFGKQGYKKASMADIAQEAGITKGMITYYFGSKKTLYLYLLEASQAHLVQAARHRLTPGITDFFKRLKIVIDIQLAAIKEHPALISFVSSLFYESDPEVAADIEHTVALEYTRLNRKILSGTDLSRFKPGFDPQLICKFILWADDGFMEELFELSAADKADALVAEFYLCLDVMQKFFYKETT